MRKMNLGFVGLCILTAIIMLPACRDHGECECDGKKTPPRNMALIPAGCFSMGDAFSEGYNDELPVHYVCITKSFYMDIHEVTNAEYKACISDGVCSPPSSSLSYTRSSYFQDPLYDQFPVVWINWVQATQYCEWAGKRLPTEAECEYAARGGLSGNRYPWGDTISGTDANYWDSGDPWDNDTSPVGSYAPNGYGLYDMAGNVWEWVNDWYSSTYYSSSPTNDPPGPPSGAFRVVRGDSWDENVYCCAWRAGAATTRRPRATALDSAALGTDYS